jgi:putative transcriptional regulator
MSLVRLAPGLLLAAPRLGDPNFVRTVVLLGRHEDDGALGWVLNGQALSPVGELLNEAEMVPAGSVLPTVPGFARVARVGGPVSSQSGWLVYRRAASWSGANEIEVGDLGVSGDAAAFDALLAGQGPADFRLLLGYAGWGPGQLDAEVQAGAWLPAPVDAELVFDLEPDDLWDAAYRRATGAAPGAFQSHTRGSA